MQKITKNITVENHNYTDEMGIRRTFVDVVFLTPDGFKYQFPVAPPIKVKRHTKGTNLMDSTVLIYKKDAEEIFERFLGSLITYKNELQHRRR